MSLIDYFFNSTKKYFLAGTVFLCMLIMLYLLLYKFLYKKIFKGKKQLGCVKIISIIMFSVYILGVIFLTCLSRPSLVAWRSFNVIPFKTFIEMKYDFYFPSINQILLNIFLFMPFGFLLPLINQKFNRWYNTVICGFLCSLLIELSQLIFSIGIFDVDDLITNTLGTIFGYCLIKMINCFIIKKNRKISNIVLSIWPLVLFVFLFSGVYVNYSTRGFGNLVRPSFNKTYNINFSLKTNLHDAESIVPMYKPVSCSKSNATQKIDEMIFSLGVIKANAKNETNKNNETNINYNSGNDSNFDDSKNNSDTKIKDKEQPIVRQYVSKNDYHSKLHYKTSDYYIEYNLFNQTFKFQNNDINLNEEVVPANSNNRDEIVFNDEMIKEKLNDFNLCLIDKMEFTNKDNNNYLAELNSFKQDKYVYDGYIEFHFDIMNNIDKLYYNIIKYSNSRDVNIISEYDAYLKLIKGKYASIGKDILYTDIPDIDESIFNLKIDSVYLDYFQDTLDYFHPAYVFVCTRNDKKYKLIVDAISVYKNLNNN